MSNALKENDLSAAPFDDEKGEPLSQATVLTYLSPNRTDKDPNNDIKVRF